MSYLVTGRQAIGRLDPRQVVAQGEAMVFEGPWPLERPVLARLDGASVERVRDAGVDGYVVEALADPGQGEAFLLAAHRMRDLNALQPYAERVGAVLERFGGRFLARAARATPLGGDFVLDRAVVVEFPTAGDAVGFYVSEIYAPLMTIRHAATDPRLLVMARSGALPAAARAAAERYLRSRAASAH